MLADTPSIPAHIYVLCGPADLIEAAIPSIDAGMRSAGYSPGQAHAMTLCLVEAVANAVKHGHAGERALPIRLQYAISPEETWASVEDTGTGFDPASVPDPTTEEGLERSSGRGVFLIRHFADRCWWDRGGRRVVIVKRRGPAGC